MQFPGILHLPFLFSSPRVVNLKEISWDLYSVRKHTINNNYMSLGSGKKNNKADKRTEGE